MKPTNQGFGSRLKDGFYILSLKICTNHLLSVNSKIYTSSFHSFFQYIFAYATIRISNCQLFSKILQLYISKSFNYTFLKTFNYTKLLSKTFQVRIEIRIGDIHTFCFKNRSISLGQQRSYCKGHCNTMI